jgi:protoporphyrin/coproporphyrin ferrochelatase
MKKGLLLINLGTPKAPTSKAIRQYLRVFLTDRRVITLPSLIRLLLVYGVILPFRPRRLVKAYQSIWTHEGSPLNVYSEKLLKALQNEAKTNMLIALSMRYSQPSIQEALNQLKHCDQITILPLYPQYASSSSGSAIEAALKHIQKWNTIPHLRVIRDFYRHPDFIQAITATIQPFIREDVFILFSYHGLPRNHLVTPDCQQCIAPCQTQESQCYRAQCFETSRLTALSLGLTSEQYTTSFQSRLGKTPWIQPYTTEILPTLAARGIKKLVVACPSFVSDCLETIEEIGEQAKQQWKSLGGQSMSLVPCLNDSPLFVKAILNLIGEES